MGSAEPLTPIPYPRLALLPGGLSAASEGERTAAVIDLGSNSWRLVVYEYVPGASWRRSGNLNEPVRIAEGVTASGQLGKAAIERGLETLDMFSRYCRARGIPREAVDAVATSAIRDAANGEELLGPAAALTGFDLEVLSAQQEARYGYVAAVNSTTLTDGAVLDLGGGSLQLVGVEGRRATALGSWPLGAVRVTERLLPAKGRVPRKALRRARAAIAEELGQVEWLGGHLVAMGGAVRNLAAAAHPGESVQGARLTRAELEDLIARLAALPADDRALPGIKASRGDIVLGAALTLEAVLEAGGFAHMEVTCSGLREGVFLSRRLLAGAEPLLPDVRASSIRNLTLQSGADIRHADHVSRLALQLHDSLAAEKVIAPEPGERGLLWAAALLHDVGMTIGYDGHAGHSRYLILNSGLEGFSPAELEAIAEVVRHHRKGTPDSGRVARCAALLRLAEQLERGHDQSVTEARFVPEGRGLRLVLGGDARLARWSLERRVSESAFKRVFGRALVVT